mmetsp:Transcript_6986/g.17764  ORF Transcript_6986/g.17764 Transcript_6986/m.17764 type:complete len:153 (-) Transcript_6986:577-1035(-)
MAASLRSITVALGGQPAPRRTGLKGPAKRGAAVVARAQDKLCKDMVNQKKDVSGLEGTVKVTFLGKGGQEFTLDCPLDTYMLDAGIAAGLELPYSCRGGICGACVGKAITGEYDASDVSSSNKLALGKAAKFQSDQRLGDPVHLWQIATLCV